LFCELVRLELFFRPCGVVLPLLHLSDQVWFVSGHGGSTHVSVCEARTLQGVYALCDFWVVGLLYQDLVEYGLVLFDSFLGDCGVFVVEFASDEVAVVSECDDCDCA
jgi:hypothetical protein